MKVSKIHGLGNDFIVFADNEGADKKFKDIAIRLCDRHTGIGGDGILVVVPSEKADIRMRIVNADGSEAEMCGNGIRCFAKFVYEEGILKREAFSVETLAGIVRPTLKVENEKVVEVTVDMGKPNFAPSSIPMYTGIVWDDSDGTEEKVLDHPLEVEGETYRVASVLLGVPHTEVFVDEVRRAPVTELGPKIEKHPFFARGTNVNFVQVVNDRHIKVRTWERGAGATLACGTGSCAAAVMSFEKGLTGREVDVELYRGVLHVEYREDGTVFMTGPAETVFETDIEL